MTRDELLHQASELHYQWANRVAEQVPTNAADQKPSGDTDYPEHHMDVSAAPAQEQDYHEALMALLASAGE